MNQLLLQVYGIRGNDNPLPILQRPVNRRQEVGHGFSGAGARFDGRHFVLVECLAHRRHHVDLLSPLFIAFQMLADGPARAQQLFYFGLVQGGDFLPGKRLHHHVNVVRRIVDDVKADAESVQMGGDCEVGTGGSQRSGRMVVNHHIRVAGFIYNGGHGNFITSRNDVHLMHDQVFFGIADEKNFVAAGLTNGVSYFFPRLRRYVFFNIQRHLPRTSRY